jgi:C-terminal processing protease CtpA/Prc
MVTLFAKENSLATIVGTKTPGRLISRTGTKVGAGYQLVFPVAAYQSWNGTRIEGFRNRARCPRCMVFRGCTEGGRHSA